MKLTAYLQHRKISREKFATALGVDAVSVWRYETGARRPTWELLHKIRELTGGRVTANDFMNDDTATPSRKPHQSRRGYRSRRVA